jgi:hypothetical protein
MITPRVYSQRRFVFWCRAETSAWLDLILLDSSHELNPAKWRRLEGASPKQIRHPVTSRPFPSQIHPKRQAGKTFHPSHYDFSSDHQRSRLQAPTRPRGEVDGLLSVGGGMERVLKCRLLVSQSHYPEKDKSDPNSLSY